MSVVLVASGYYLPGQTQWSVDRDNRTELLPLRVEENLYVEPSGIGSAEALPSPTVSQAATQIEPSAIDTVADVASPALSAQGILNMCGFETGDNSEIFAKTAGALINATSARSADYGLYVPFNGTAHYAEIRSAQMGSLDLNRTLYFRFYFKVVSTPAELSTSSILIFSVKDTAGGRKMSIALAPDGTLEVYDSADGLVGTGPQLSAGTWYRIHGKCAIGSTAAVGVGVDRTAGTYDVSGTADTNSNAIRAVRLGTDGTPFGIDGAGWEWYFDDLTLRDDAEPGVGEIVRMTPDADGNSAEWTGSFTDVDEVPADEDGTVLSTANGDVKQSVALESASTAGVTGEIRAVKVVARAKHDGSGNSTLRLFARSGGQDYELGSRVLTTGYIGVGSMLVLNPADGGAWESADLDALQVGVKHELVSGLPTVSVTHLSTMVEQVPVQQLSPSGVATAESFGTAALSVIATISPSSVDSAEAFGTAYLELRIVATGIDTAEEVPVPFIANTQWVQPTGIDTEEAHGSTTLSPGAVTVSPSSISSLETHGTTALEMGIAPLGIGTSETFGSTGVGFEIVPSSISSAESHGTTEVQPGAVTVSPESVTSSEDHGATQVQPGAVSVSPSAIDTGETVGTHAVAIGISVSAISSLEGFGTAEIQPGAVQLSPTGISSAEDHGSSAVQPGAVSVSPEPIGTMESHGTTRVDCAISASSIDSAESHGQTSLEVFLVVSSISTSEDVGSHTVQPGAIQVLPETIATGESHGQPSLGLNLSVSGIDSVESFGTVVVEVFVTPTGIGSEESVGTHSVQGSAVTIDCTAIASGEQIGDCVLSSQFQISPTGIDGSEVFGTPRLDAGVAPLAVSSTETFGTTAVGYGVQVASIVTGEDFGTNRIDLSLVPIGISSDEAVSSCALQAGAVSVSCVSIGTAEAFGTLVVEIYVVCSTISTGEAVGEPVVSPGAFSILADPAWLGETFGTCALVPGEVSVIAFQIDSSESLGSTTVQPADWLVEPLAIASDEAPGTARLIRYAPPRPGRRGRIGATGTGKPPGSLDRSGVVPELTASDVVPQVPKQIPRDRLGSQRSIGMPRSIPTPKPPRSNLG